MNLPQDFIDSLKGLDVDADALIKALESESPTSIRVNPLKGEKLGHLERVPWCDTGYYLPHRPKFTFDPLFHAGVYYVQEAGSMYLDVILKTLMDEVEHPFVMDLCAAPGGKSTLISSRIGQKGRLVANEVIRKRANILKENLVKWGIPNYMVMNQDTHRLSEQFPGIFNIITVDAPCSGEGMFRKDPKARSEWSLDNVERCVNRQRDILTDAWAMLAPGGFLVYSTCTFNRRENEEQVEWLVEEFGGMVESGEWKTGSGEWKMESGKWGLRFYPHLVKAEGFFISVIRKPGELSSIDPKMVIPSTEKPYEPGDHEWVMRTDFDGDFPAIDLDLNEAIEYLQKQVIRTNEHVKGYHMVTYNGHRLGWVKGAGNRFNNLYPKHWRILTSPGDINFDENNYPWNSYRKS